MPTLSGGQRREGSLAYRGRMGQDPDRGAALFTRGGRDDRQDSCMHSSIVEFKRWLVEHPNRELPSADGIRQLVSEMIKGGWI